MKTKNIKRAKIILILCALFTVLLPRTVLAEASASITAESSAQEIYTAFGLLTPEAENALAVNITEKTITLNSDLTVEKEVTFAGGSWTLLGNGQTLTMARGSIVLMETAVLNLGQSEPSEMAELTVKSTDDTRPILSMMEESQLNLYDGVTLGPSISRGTAAGVAVDGSSVFRMYGGTITECCNENSVSGGVYVESYAQFHLYDGVIENCSGWQGGAVGLSGAPAIGGTVPMPTALFQMHGGKIRNCTDYWYGGGAVCLYSPSPVTFIMDGGEISGCSPVNGSGNKYGGAIMVYVTHEDAVIQLNGGTITGNSAAYGGGVFLFKGNVRIDPDNFKLYGNVAANVGDDLYLNGSEARISTLPRNENKDLTCSHEIDGWYIDGCKNGEETPRWSCLENHLFYPIPEDGITTGEYGLKAAHGHYEMTATPETLDFGSVEEGTSELPAEQTVTVTNRGIATLTLTQPTAENFTLGELSKTELAPGETATFTVRPKADFPEGNYGETITIEGVSGPKALSATVSVAFLVTAPPEYSLLPIAGPGGTLFPSDEVIVPEGEDQSFEIHPDEGYHILDVLVDGVSIGAQTSYTFLNVLEDHVIEAVFEKDSLPEAKHEISAVPGSIRFESQEKGTPQAAAPQTVTVTNLGTESVTLTQPTAKDFILSKLSKTELAPGETAVFTVLPMEDLPVGSHEEILMITGISGGESVCASVSVSFTITEPPLQTNYTVTATAGEGGSISPAGTVTLPAGRNGYFTILPDNGYRLSEVLVDGVSIGAVTSYTFENLQSSHTIEAFFEKTPGTTEPPESPVTGDRLSWNLGLLLLSGAGCLALTFRRRKKDSR